MAVKPAISERPSPIPEVACGNSLKPVLGLRPARREIAGLEPAMPPTSGVLKRLARARCWVAGRKRLVRQEPRWLLLDLRVRKRAHCKTAPRQIASKTQKDRQ